jgi:hypothetical protein
MELQVLDYDFSICQVSNLADIDFSDQFCFVAKTPDEISVVCSSLHIPKNTIERDDGWKGFRVVGVLDFSLVGILSKISHVLAANAIPLFAISTFNTDYILIRNTFFGDALKVLEDDGFVIV